MITALMLIGLGVCWRLLIAFQVLNLPNAVPLAALALYAGLWLPRRWAPMVAPAILLLADLIIDARHGYGFYFGSRLVGYGYFALLGLLGSYAPKASGLPARVLMALGGATGFFLLSNFAVWAGGEGFGRPQTLAGLLSTYADGLPFYRNSLGAELLGAVALAAVDALRHRAPAAEGAAARME